MSCEGSGALVWDARRLRIAADAAGVGLWSWNIDTNEIALDQCAHALWGVPRDGPVVTFENLSARIDPADLDRVGSAFRATRDITGPYEIDFRVLRDDALRWVSARGQGADVGIVGRVMFGVFLDVTKRKQAEETRELLAGEMSHRIKNLFAITSALTAISARSTATTTEMAHDLTQRLTALGHAQDLVRPIPGEAGNKGADLGELLTILLAPYGDKTGAAKRVHIAAPELRVGEAAVTTLALVIHELATNSIKYGALSSADGVVDLSCTADADGVVLVWTERGGPRVAAPAGPVGFGSKLVARSVSGQLGGSIAFEWPPEGVVVTLRISKTRLAA